MDGFERILTNMSEAKQLEPCYILRPLGCYLVVLWIMGTCLNGSILYVFIRNKKLRQSSTNIFIGGLILADFIGAGFEIPLPAIALLGCRFESSLIKSFDSSFLFQMDLCVRWMCSPINSGLFCWLFEYVYLVFNFY